MGSFANLGALTGAASGWNEGSKAAEKAKQHKLDQMREERLLALEHQRTMERDQAGYAQEDKTLGAEQKFETSERVSGQEFETAERTAEENFEASQADKDRASDLEVEKAKTKADKDKVKKWNYKTTEDKTTVDLEGNKIVTPGVTKATSPFNHKTYVQQGDMWRLEGDKERVRYPKEKDYWEKKLLDEPSQKNMTSFYKHFGYLPGNALAAQERWYESQE